LTFSDATLAELKDRLGSPVPYRVSVTVCWWSIGLAIWMSGCSPNPPAGFIALFAVAMISGIYFFGRVFRRALAREVIFLWLWRPTVGIPLLGWLWFGNPRREAWTGRAVFALAAGGLVVSIVGIAATGCLSGRYGSAIEGL
jgi:hypothetical protein